MEFADRSRIHSGCRLLKRAVRHAMDPEGVSILSSSCCIIAHMNTTGLHINHTVKASMKKASYIVKTSFTSTDILAVSCECKAGSSANENVICVHILPVLLQLSLLIFDGLAEHMLCEIANDIPPDIDKLISVEEMNRLRDAIIILKRANSDIDLDNTFKHLSIISLLTNYNVGTQSSKKGPGPPSIIEKYIIDITCNESKKHNRQ